MSNTISPPSSRSSSTRSPTASSPGKDVLRDFWRDFTGAVDDIKDLRIAQVLDALDEMLAPHLFPPSTDGTDPRKCPTCGNGRLSLKLGKFGAFVGCSNYPECRSPASSRPAPTAHGGGMRKLGKDPETGLEVTLRSRPLRPLCPARRRREGREAEARRPARRAGRPTTSTSRRRWRCCRCRARSASIPKTASRSSPASAASGPYVQHGKTYANLDSRRGRVRRSASTAR